MTWVSGHGPDELYAKFEVIRVKTGESIGEDEFVFVLRPERDEAAWVALRSYAWAVHGRSPKLSAAITERLNAIARVNGR